MHVPRDVTLQLWVVAPKTNESTGESHSNVIIIIGILGIIVDIVIGVGIDVAVGFTARVSSCRSWSGPPTSRPGGVARYSPHPPGEVHGLCEVLGGGTEAEAARSPRRERHDDRTSPPLGFRV